MFNFDAKDRKFRKPFDNKLFGFTLAEIILVLVILGVVAAVAIPSSIQNFRKKEMLTRLKIAYSMLVNVTEQSIIENGFPRNVSNAEFFNTYLRPYLRVAKDCGSPNREIRYKTDENGNKIKDENGNFIKDGYKFVNEDDFDNNRCFAGPSGGIYGLNDEPNENNSLYGDSYNVVLKNGMSLSVRSQKNGSFQDNLIFVDLDGPKKGYSKMGQDTFMFTWAGADTLSICDEDNCKPHQHDVPELIPGFTVWYTRSPSYYMKSSTLSDWELLKFCSANGNGSNGVPAGGLCGQLIIQNGFRYPNDYPFSQAWKKPEGFVQFCRFLFCGYDISGYIDIA